MVKMGLNITVEVKFKKYNQNDTLYSVSFVISTRRIIYICLKNPINSSFVVVTVVAGASKLWVAKTLAPRSTVISGDVLSNLHCK